MDYYTAGRGVDSIRPRDGKRSDTDMVSHGRKKKEGTFITGARPLLPSFILFFRPKIKRKHFLIFSKSPLNV